MSCDSNSPVADLDLVLYIGDTFTRSFLFLDSAGDAIDMTGQEARIQLRTTPSETDATADWDGDYFGGDDSAGEFVLSVPATETALLEARVYSYDLQITSGANVRTYIAGALIAVKDVTR